MPIEVVYSDVNLLAGVEPDELVFNDRALNQNIAAILDTPIGSKWFRPRIGSNLNRHLFEPIDEITAEKIRRDLASALEANYERRLVFTRIEVIPDPQNEQYFVSLEYTAPELESRMFTFQFNYSRGF